MTLGFTQKINGKPTLFVEKILSGLHGLEGFKGFQLTKNYKHDLDYLETAPPKLHTIREDAHNRWKAGNDIHFVINNRLKTRFQFAPVIKCISTQEIEIKWVENPEYKERYKPEIYIDGELYYSDLKGFDKGLAELSKNDGFEKAYDLPCYFNKGVKGKIIHWTDLKY